MQKRKVRDENGLEIPTDKQLGISYDELAEMPQEAVERLYINWREKQKIKKTQRNASIAERNLLKSNEHWYNSVSKTLLREAVLKTIPHYHIIMQSLIKRSTPKSILDYYMSGYNRVNEMNLSLHSVSYTKLKRFPQYNSDKNCIEGSPSQIMIMYMELFPPIIRVKKKISLD